ncbi:adenosylcobinamide-GDP ribazoletransferase [Nocardioides solisilvae]|uniref:adenosylcobinamide-GDP ribazoletransferase n=1 Tax=Nocardioides solisilvae TaxID=1542435 RepID=UPI000D7484A4|nr:adenosylcobinamide-GDP ribazoletransferase [Nocardioides solisilvae]
MRDGWRLSVGTLTALPVPPPRAVDRRSARDAVLLAPVAVLPLAAGVTLLGLVGDRFGTPTPVVALLAVGLLALGTRALHWDGLSDTVDGLAASYDRERALTVMRSGTSGPAGVLATVLVAGLQVAGLTSLLGSARGAVLAGLLVCVSRAALTLTCRRGVPPARRDGLGNPLAGVVPPGAVLALWGLAAAGVAVVAAWYGAEWWRGLVALGLGAVVVVALVRRTTRRFGGVTGDVYGAAVELTVATLVVALA